MKDGDLLMSHINSVDFVGRTVVYHNELPILIHGMNLLRLVPNEIALSDFYYYLFKAKWVKSQIRAITHKSVNQASMNTTSLKQIDLYIPFSKKEQRDIVVILDSLSDKVARLQENYDQTINLCNDLKQSLLKSIFE
jgi:type I restriction enzyme S subunit